VSHLWYLLQCSQCWGHGHAFPDAQPLILCEPLGQGPDDCVIVLGQAARQQPTQLVILDMGFSQYLTSVPGKMRLGHDGVGTPALPCCC
jgi:hypothetical protein